MKACRDRRYTAPLIRDLGTSKEHQLLGPPSWAKNPWYPLNRRLVGSQKRSGHFREERLLAPCGELKPVSSTP